MWQVHFVSASLPRHTCSPLFIAPINPLVATTHLLGQLVHFISASAALFMLHALHHCLCHLARAALSSLPSFVSSATHLLVQQVLRALHQCLCCATPGGVTGLLRLADHQAHVHAIDLGVHVHLSSRVGADAAQVL